MRILVTGATGFVGSAFCRLALSRGHEIGAMILPAEPVPTNFPGVANLTWLRGTLAEPPWATIEQYKPQACVHFAWIATPGVYLESPENLKYLEWSIDFVRRICRVGCHYVLAAGTCIEYRIGNKPLSEEHTVVEPTTTYARCKNALRIAMEEDSKTQGFSFGWGRVFYPYGVGEHPARLCSSIIQTLEANEPIVLKTPESTKDYIYIEDLAEAFLAVLEKQYHGAINLGTGMGQTVLQISEILARMMAKPGLVKVAEPRLVDPLGFVVADASRLRELGWRPAHDLESGLEKLLATRRTALPH